MPRTVTITVIDDGINYEPGYLRVTPMQVVEFRCELPFKVKFLHGSPFTEGTEFYLGHAIGTVVDGTQRRMYQYQVVAYDKDRKPDGLLLDGGCPSIDVV
ncbi:MAG: hypothetical protein ACKV22_00935 [Bryobacteraceae bacterium]